MPPVDTYWKETSTGNAGAAGNYGSGALPVTGDKLRFNRGAVALNSGFTALEAEVLALLLRNDGYTGAWGLESNRFKVGATLLEYEQAQAANVSDYLEGAFTTAKIADTGQGTLFLKCTGNTTIELEKGRVVLLAGSEFGDLFVGGAQLTIEAGCTQQTGKELFFTGPGLVVNSSPLQNVAGDAGQINMEEGSSLAGVARLGRVLMDLATTGTIAEVRNLIPGRQGLRTRRAYKGFAITTYRKHRLAVDDIPVGDNLGTIGSTTVVHSTVEA